MTRLERAWMTFGIAMFLFQLVSLVSGATAIVGVFVLGLFIVGCGLSFLTLFKIINYFTGLTKLHPVKFQIENVQRDKRSKAEKYLEKVLGEHDEDEVDKTSQMYS